MGKKTMNQMNNVLICSLSIIYLTYLSFMRKTKLVGLLVGVYLSAYLLTNKHLSSVIVAIILALCMELMLKSYETWGDSTNILDGSTIYTDYANLSAPVQELSRVCNRIGNEDTCNSDDNQGCVWFNDPRTERGAECVPESILMRNAEGELLEKPALKCSKRLGQEMCGTDCLWENSDDNADNHRCVSSPLRNIVEPFKGKSKKKRRRRRRKVENFDDDEVNESYIDLGSSFLEAYKSLTPKQIERMSSDTKSLMGHQKKLIETLDNLGPVIKGGKKIMEQFKHYFKDEI